MTTDEKNNVEASYVAAADLLEEAGQFESALAKYDEGIALVPQSAWLHARKGRSLYKLERHQDAIEVLNVSLQLQPDAPTTLFIRAQAYEKSGNIRAALADYEKSAKIKPKADVFVNIGLIHQFMRNYCFAAEAYRSAMALTPKNERIAKLLKNLPAA